MLYSIIGILVVILDQLVKFWVEKTITLEKPIIELIPNVLSIVRVNNDGAAFSFLSGGSARIWFIILTVIFTVLVIIALATNFIKGSFGRWCLVLVTAGGVSNCLDRVLYGYVVDMFKIELFDFAVFNVADIFITVGCIAFIIYILFGGEKEKEADSDEFDEADIEPKEKIKLPKAKKKEREYIPADDEDDDFIPSARPIKKKTDEEIANERIAAIKKSRAARNSNPEASTSSDRFESFFAGRAEKTEAPKSAPVKVKKVEDDPFAEWDKAVQRRNPVPREEPKPAPAAEQPKYPEFTQEKKNEPVVTDEFDLDSILNEFK